MNTEKLVADLVTAQTRVGVLEAAEQTHTSALTAANERADGIQTQLTEAQAEVTRLTGELETAQGQSKAPEADAAVTWLTASLTKLLTAAGKPAENLPTDVAALTAAIDTETKGLTAIIPAGGASEPGAESPEAKPAASLSAFKSNRR